MREKRRRDLTRQDKTRQDKTRQDKTRQDKTRQDKTRQTTNLSLYDGIEYEKSRLSVKVWGRGRERVMMGGRVWGYG
jgi:hypothetical protein